MKKHRILSAILSGVMMLSGTPVITEQMSLTAYAASSKLSAPTGFKNTAATAETITLSWDPVKGADAYRVYIYNKVTDEFETYKNVKDTSCKVKGLSAGTAYRFRVAALVKSGDSYKVQTKSDTVKAKTAEAVKLAAPANIKYTVSENSVRLTWNAVKGADAYSIYMYSNVTDEFEKYKNVSGTVCNVSGLTSGTTYRFRVAALVSSNGKYKEQTKSGPVAAKTSEKLLSAPENVTGKSASTYITLSWDPVNGADAYRVYMLNSSTGKYEVYQNVAKNTCTVKDLKSGTAYKFMIAALVNKNGSYKEQTRTGSLSASTSVKQTVVPDSSGGSSNTGESSGNSSGAAGSASGKMSYTYTGQKYTLNTKTMKIHFYNGCRAENKLREEKDDHTAYTDDLQWALKKGYDKCGLCWR